MIKLCGLVVVIMCIVGQMNAQNQGKSNTDFLYEKYSFPSFNRPGEKVGAQDERMRNDTTEVPSWQKRYIVANDSTTWKWAEMRLVEPKIQKVQILLEDAIINGYRKTEYYKVVYSYDESLDGCKFEIGSTFYYDRDLTLKIDVKILGYRNVYDETVTMDRSGSWIKWN
jgi:hypothetical protein